MNAVTHLARADFRERVRRFSFLVIVALAVFLGYQVISGFFELRLGTYRGLLNAAWIGTLMALTLSFFLSIIGFYVVRGNIQLDRQTGVGQILAASPMSKMAYVTGKVVSNTAVLLLVVGVLTLAALAMLLIHGEDKTLNLYQLLMPFLVFAGPVALLVAAVAILFEAVPVLRQSGGNVIYFFLWLFTIPFVGGHLLAFDVVEQGMAVALQAQGADYRGGIVLGATGAAGMQTFLWTGFDWPVVAVSRLVYVLLSLLVAALAALSFDRFDTIQSRPRRFSIRRFFKPFAVLRTPHFVKTSPCTRRNTPYALSPVTPATNSLHLFATLVVAELKLLLKGRAFLWYAGAAGLFAASLLSPVETVRGLLPYIWLWPLLLWSELGVRETRYRVDQLLFSAPAPLWRQLPATWTAGVLLALILGSGALVRLLTEPTLLPGFVAGMLFIPSLALFLGVVAGTERPLQIVLLIAWYLGPLNGLALFDLTGATETAVSRGIPWLYIAASPLLFGLALLARQRQLA
jgi:uncharacterized membrane protein (DUF485 family)